MNVRETQLIRIADQAELLARRARNLNRLYAKQADPGDSPVSYSQNAEAARDMQTAFMSVLRVIAEYL